MSLIWATRGWGWGFRFIRNDGGEDPLPVYDSVFRSEDDAPTIYRRLDDRVALRFPDPEGRKDRAGRPIFHDFVVFGPQAEEIDSIEAGMQVVWPAVADAYSGWWDGVGPPGA